MEMNIIGKFSFIERGLRLLIAFSLVSLVLFQELPSWSALIAVYPFTTALVAWDPVYAVIQSIQSIFNKKDAGLELASEN